MGKRKQRKSRKLRKAGVQLGRWCAVALADLAANALYQALRRTHSMLREYERERKSSGGDEEHDRKAQVHPS